MTDEKTRALIAEARHEVMKSMIYDAVTNVAGRLADALEAALTVPDGDVRERLASLIDNATLRADSSDCEMAADAILAAFPILSRDIAGEIEAEADDSDRDGINSGAYGRGLRRAAEIARNGR